jgi:hypothetical protein
MLHHLWREGLPLRMWTLIGQWLVVQSCVRVRVGGGGACIGWMDVYTHKTRAARP